MGIPMSGKTEMGPCQGPILLYIDLTLSQDFQPMAAQLSMKAALPLALSLATASCHSNDTESWVLTLRCSKSLMPMRGSVDMSNQMSRRPLMKLSVKHSWTQEESNARWDTGRKTHSNRWSYVSQLIEPEWRLCMRVWVSKLGPHWLG